jgi:uncharacterized protein YndB with AHSA1/START domain
MKDEHDELVQHEVWIDAERDVVFDALTTRPGLDGWWGKVVSVSSEVGSVVELDHGHGDHLRMRITDLVPGEAVEWECLTDFDDPRYPGSEWLGHRLRFELRTAEAATEGPVVAQSMGIGSSFTILRFRQSGWEEGSRWRAFCNSAWGETLAVHLKGHCEAGVALRR